MLRYVYSKSQEIDFDTSHSASLVTHNIHLTCLEGDPVGTSVGFRGDWLGLDVGCEMNDVKREEK